MTILEAAACGLPIVSTRVGVVRSWRAKLPSASIHPTEVVRRCGRLARRPAPRATGDGPGSPRPSRGGLRLRAEWIEFRRLYASLARREHPTPGSPVQRCQTTRCILPSLAGLTYTGLHGHPPADTPGRCRDTSDWEGASRVGGCWHDCRYRRRTRTGDAVDRAPETRFRGCIERGGGSRAGTWCPGGGT